MKSHPHLHVSNANCKFVCDPNPVKDHYLISLGPSNLGFEVLHSLVQASVAAQLGLYRGQIRSPLSFVNATLVLLHPGQQVLDIAQRHIIQLRPHLHGTLLSGLYHRNLASSHSRLQTKVVIGAQVHQAFMDAEDPVEI